MPLGKLYTYPKAPRSTMVLFVVKYLKLDVEICNAFPIKVYPEKGGVGEGYLAKFHTGKVPTFETTDRFCVYESNAVAWFRETPTVHRIGFNSTNSSEVSHQSPKSTLHGSNLREETTVLRWASFTNYELLLPIMAWIQPIIGRAPSSPEILGKAEEGCELTVRAIDTEIKGKQYLVGDTLSFADLFVVSGLARGYKYVKTQYFVMMYSTDILGRSSRRHGQRNIQVSTSTTCASETTGMGYLTVSSGLI